MEAVWSWFNNSLVQSDIISPLIGAILGALLAGLSASPARVKTASLSVQQTTINYYTYNVNHSAKPSDSNDAAAYVMGLLILAVVTIWGYSGYSSEILSYWSTILVTCLAFVSATTVISFIKRQFSSWDWVWYIGAALAALLMCAYFLSLAQDGVIPGAREAAQAYGLRHAWFFYEKLNESQRNWTVCELAGVLAGVLSTLAAALRAAHYLALMNQRGSGFLDPLWRAIVRMTLPVSKKGAMLGLIIMVVFSWISLNGWLYQLVNRSS